MTYQMPEDEFNVNIQIIRRQPQEIQGDLKTMRRNWIEPPIALLTRDQVLERPQRLSY